MLALTKHRFYALCLQWVGALCLLVLFQGWAYAQKPAVQDIQAVALTLEQARDALEGIQNTLQNSDQSLNEVHLNQLRERLNKLQSQALTVESTLVPALDSSRARLAELGQIDPDMPEAVDLKKQRDALQQEVADLDGQLKIARLIAVEVKQGSIRLEELRKKQFQAILSQRFLPPLSLQSLELIQESVIADLGVVLQVFHELNASLSHVATWVFWLLAGLALLWALSLLLIGRWFRRYILLRAQSTRLRRTLLAVFTVAFYMLFATGSVALLLSVFLFADELSDELHLFLRQFVMAVAVAAYIAGLGRALLSPHKPTWRLPHLPNEVATSLASLPWLLGGFILFLWSVQKITELMSTSLNSLLFVNSIFALGLNAIVFMAVWRAERHYQRQGRLELGTPLATSLHSLALKLVLLAIFSSVVVWLFGYIALSHFIIQEVVWLGGIILTAYLLLHFVSDLAEVTLNTLHKEAEEKSITARQLKVWGQVILLLTGTLKIVLILLALFLLFLPVGEEPGVWLQRRLNFLLQGVTFGEVTLKPAELLYAALVLVVGVFVVRHLQHWLAHKYLPYTNLEESMGASTARLVSYVGYTLVGVLVLSTVGIGFERLAWIVSALSVGIGFGLQAVVQNFVSGLLLLAERPIKVGDWVAIGDDIEGNVRQINARATEIEMFDRSTVIVPNSELITKTVRNITLSEPLGRGRITVVMPLTVPSTVVVEVLMEAAASVENVMEDPGPYVVVDGFEHGGLAFSLYIYLSSPRLVRITRSAVFLKVLARFEELEINLNPIQRMEIIES